MDITPLVSPDKKIITSYGNKGFSVNNIRIDGSILIMPDKLESYAHIDNIANLSLEHLGSLNQLTGDNIILLIGCGNVPYTLEQDLVAQIKNNFLPITIDMMTTGAACRTYNILLTEGRNVAAFLIAI
ncbi:hypothetical protein NOVO_00820 [Rickettsiales bacterium Ac37b]|nr:hypothetical protein NOVO_00820 [Rickettsiales bacterium Ac37b]